jgi:membrane fusion protein (multidrug efflux system)
MPEVNVAAAPADAQPPINEKAAAEDKKARRKRRRILNTIGAIFLIIGLICFLYWLCWGQFHEYTDDAYVDGNLVRLMPQVAGTVTTINTDNTQLVLQGQTLVKLDPTDTRIQLDRAKANLALTIRQVRELYENVQQTIATLILKKADLEKAKYDFKRRRGLVGERAISREEMQNYLTLMEGAQAQYDFAKSKYMAALSLVENTTLYQHPTVIAAEINLKNAYLNFVRTTVVSPVTGYVAKRAVQLGQQVSQRTSMMAIVPLNEVWIEANYKESQLGRLRIGQTVELIADAYEGFTFHGKIHGLSAGTGSAFDLLPPQNATGNWIKIVQRVPVRIDLDPEELKKHPLRIGLSVRVTTRTFNTDGDILTLNTKDQPTLITPVFNNQLAMAEQLIDEIVRNNAPDISLGNMQGTAVTTHE